MKKILTVFILSIIVWGCAKKIAPANSGSSTAGTPAMPPTPGVAVSSEASASPATNTDPGTVNAEKEKTANLTEEEITALTGQRIYNNKCGRCHELMPVVKYTAGRWSAIMEVMAPRANLTGVEKEQVYTYVKMNAKK